ncbi:hypothetical protein BKA70DRAFT_1281036 [Coprinopsis sp. MPI-PUGE-AT-0042]|nr:hypothetical protein BKA70DRAFT_1281036 [Coprinopsis sp. MPI-PUGE-AT-0042]
MKNKRRQKGSSARGVDKAAASSNVLNHLKRAIFDDLLPTDDTTNDIWGFNRAKSSVGLPNGCAGPNCLLGIYQGLVKYQGIDPQQLDRWRQKGILLPEIKRLFEAIPAESRGSYYPWLLRNEYVLDRSMRVPRYVVYTLPSGGAYANRNRRESNFSDFLPVLLVVASIVFVVVSAIKIIDFIIM